MRRPLIASLLLAGVTVFAAAAFIHALAPSRADAQTSQAQPPMTPAQKETTASAQEQTTPAQKQTTARSPQQKRAPQPAQQPQGKPSAQQQAMPQGQQPGGTGGPGGPGGPPQGVQGETPFDTSLAHADEMVADMIGRLGPKANAPAESVFKNIQMFKGQPASNVMKIMVYGFSRGLGVRCGECHVRPFDSDEKKEKKIAREMFRMTGDINRTYLANIKDLDDEMPSVDCWTCHRGHPKPEVAVGR